MMISPIRTEADYEQALCEVKDLMDAQPETDEADRLDVLVTLVEAGWAFRPTCLSNLTS
jgi:HTH-type transcriptional regulator/antitoxin HigA